MSTLFWVLTSIGLFVIYTFVGFVVGRYHYSADLWEHGHEKTTKQSRRDATTNGIITGVLWPITVAVYAVIVYFKAMGAVTDKLPKSKVEREGRQQQEKARLKRLAREYENRAQLAQLEEGKSD